MKWTAEAMFALAAILLWGVVPTTAQETEEEPLPQILIRDVKVWDGVSSSRETYVDETK